MTDHETSRGKHRRRRLLVALGVAAFLLSACGTGLPQSSLEPAGDVARQQYDLFLIVFWIAAVVFVVVEGALVFISIRYRRKRGEEAEQIHGNTRLEVIWTVIPALILAGLAFPTVSTIFSLARTPPNALQVTVIGHQWWWEFQYPEQEIVTANELVIPAGRPVHLVLRSDETPGGTAGFTTGGKPIPQDAIPVIHSFWVPRLAGKQDLVPGREGSLNIEADEPGTYRGQCAEFCGISHANMRFRVIAETPEGFDAWVAGQQADPARATTGTPEAQGEELFTSFQGATVSGSCAACHSLDPTAGGATGPNLAHIGSRTTFAAGLVEMNEENLARWLDSPRSVKPGVVMPDYRLTPEQIDALVAYLMSLE